MGELFAYFIVVVVVPVIGIAILFHYLIKYFFARRQPFIIYLLTPILYPAIFYFTTLIEDLPLLLHAGELATEDYAKPIILDKTIAVILCVAIGFIATCVINRASKLRELKTKDIR